MSLINDVLDISKIDSGKITLNPEPYCYSKYVDAVRQMLEPLCQKKNLGFDLISNGSDEVILCVDKIRLNQITLNLISNAVKYTPEGGKITFVSSNRRLDDGKMEGVFSVRDTGIGMSEAFQKKMYDPFLQEYENPYRPADVGGTGLGLSIVKRLVELIGGSIFVRSEVGKGTEITVRFVGTGQQTSEADKSQADPRLASRLTKLSGRVLLAEDNPINTEIAVRLLETLGLTVVRARNGLEAVRLFENSKPGEFEAIFMDIQMPVMNGYEACERIRASSHPDGSRIPIAAMTADAYTEAMERSGKAGMTTFLTKPIDVRKIYTVLTATEAVKNNSGSDQCDQSRPGQVSHVNHKQ